MDWIGLEQVSLAVLPRSLFGRRGVRKRVSCQVKLSDVILCAYVGGLIGIDWDGWYVCMYMYLGMRLSVFDVEGGYGCYLSELQLI